MVKNSVLSSSAKADTFCMSVILAALEKMAAWRLVEYHLDMNFMWLAVWRSW